MDDVHLSLILSPSSETFMVIVGMRKLRVSERKTAAAMKGLGIIVKLCSRLVLKDG